MPRSLRPVRSIPAARVPLGVWAAPHNIAVALRNALDSGQIQVAYQPVVALSGRVWTGVEALARWTDPRRGPIPPDVFIPVAERSGLIGELTRQVTQHVCRDWSSWRQIKGGSRLQVAVNLSAADLMTRATVDGLTEALTSHDLPLDQLTLEITETAPLAVGSGTVEALSELRNDGTEVALDDFGAGQSRLADLRRVPVTALKLDKSFTHSQHAGLADPEMAAGVQTLASAFGLDTIAEGVETKDEAHALEDLGYGRAQGWLYGRPTSSDSIEEQLRLPRQHLGEDQVCPDETPDSRTA